MDTWVYLFEHGDRTMLNLLGGKGAGLAEMSRVGLPVPPGFTITAQACQAYYTHDKIFPDGMWSQCKSALKAVEHKTGKRFGDPAQPLLVSVRSGARVSMPGMMDTVPAHAVGARAVKVTSPEDQANAIFQATWMLVDRPGGPSGTAGAAETIPSSEERVVPVWTDDYSNLITILK